MLFEHRSADATAHRMAVQVQRLAVRVFLSHGFGESRKIGRIPTPIVDPHVAPVIRVARGGAMPTMIDRTHRIPGEQEIPDHFIVFFGELGEPVAQHDATAESGGSALIVFRVELCGIIGEIVQGPTQRPDPRAAFSGRGIETPFGQTCLKRRLDGIRHGFGVIVLLEQGHFHNRLPSVAGRLALSQQAGLQSGSPVRFISQPAASPQPFGESVSERLA